MDKSKKAARTAVILSFLAIYIIWGSTYLGILLAIKTIPPFMMAGSRFFIAGAIMLIWSTFKGEKIPELSHVLQIGFSGLLMLFMGNGAVTWSEQYLPSGLAAIIVATVPLWFVLLDKKQWHYYFTNKKIILGLAVGFAGVILLFAGKSSAALFDDIMKVVSLIALLAGTLAWTAGSLFVKYRKLEGSTLMKTAIQMTTAGLAFFVTSIAFSEHKEFSLGQVSAESALSLAYLVFFGSIVAYLAYMWLLTVRPASLVGTYAYVNPVVAVFLGWLVASETISLQKIIGLVIIIAGLAIVNFSKKSS